MLKLGMFVRIVLDSATTEDLLTVPVSAVVEIEGQKGVFLPAEAKGKGKDKDREGHAYTFHPLKLGRESGDRRVVLAGLEEGTPVVSSGAFSLKAELILQNEPEED
jgi:multidrug efflux pump subunit AcrA (membrane-fusion protein)